jgi:hypothetical protein
MLIYIILIIIFFLVILLFNNKEYFNNKKNYICILSVEPSYETYKFLKEIKKNIDYEIVIAIDNNDYEIPNYDNEIKIIKYNKKVCEDAGYKNTVLWKQNEACSRDKALYYFNKENIDYNFIWFIEEDVFIPDIYTIQNIDKKYPSSDLLSGTHSILNEHSNDWYWPLVRSQTTLDLPYANSMICAIRCSNKLMKSIDDYATKYKTLFLDEAMFNTLALHDKLEVLPIKELQMYWEYDWKLEELNKEYLYHPIKSIEQQVEFRKLLVRTLSVEYYNNLIKKNIKL